MKTKLTAPDKLPAFAVIIRAMGGNGADDQRAALTELHRRGLWLSPEQAAAALHSAGYALRPVGGRFPGRFYAARPDGEYLANAEIGGSLFPNEKAARDAALADMGYRRAQAAA